MTPFFLLQCSPSAGSGLCASPVQNGCVATGSSALAPLGRAATP